MARSTVFIVLGVLAIIVGIALILFTKSANLLNGVLTTLVGIVLLYMGITRSKKADTPQK
ncbi:MAG: hypothetical protein KGH72_05885 [Candidatus Micrarchaeota archaeon]|nr:hypothetical protein [Candidatus Micrarchaeota archaeon]